jgi:hypothetical protein
MANANSQKKSGSGRKAVRVKRSVARRGKTLTRATAAEILGVQDECALWDRLLHSDDDRLVLAALKYLTDRRDGKSYQPANPFFVEKAPLLSQDPRVADHTIAAALENLLPPPSSQVTVAQVKSLTTD